MSQGDTTGILKLYRQDCGVKKMSIELTLCFIIPKVLVVQQNHIIVLSTLNFFYYVRGFQNFHMFILGQLENCKN